MKALLINAKHTINVDTKLGPTTNAKVGEAGPVVMVPGLVPPLQAVSREVAKSQLPPTSSDYRREDEVSLPLAGAIRGVGACVAPKDFLPTRNVCAVANVSRSLSTCMTLREGKFMCWQSTVKNFFSQTNCPTLVVLVPRVFRNYKNPALWEN